MFDALERVLVPASHLRDGFPSIIAGVEEVPAFAGGFRNPISSSTWRGKEVKSHQDGVRNRPKCRCGIIT